MSEFQTGDRTPRPGERSPLPLIAAAVVITLAAAVVIQSVRRLEANALAARAAKQRLETAAVVDRNAGDRAADPNEKRTDTSSENTTITTRAAAKPPVEVAAADGEDVSGKEPSSDAKSDDPKSTEKPADDKSDEGKTAETKPDDDAPAYPFRNRIRVPDDLFEGGAGWLNTSGDIRLKDLRGKIVILDFWTYCCINCMHVLPDLAYIEQKYPKEVVVIGVHSAKFDNEKETDNIRRAVQRYNIEHPVVNDAEMEIWNKIGIRAWPSLLIIDAEGKACLLTSGEGKQELLDAAVGALVKYHRATKTLDETPVRFDLEREKMPPTPLKFPGKVVADEAGGRLFIADTNHNRIVVSSLDGKLQQVIGSGARGKKDGGFDKASFDHPQGMALAGDVLYVADTENHLIRAVHLKEKTVATLAGTGEQDRQRTPGGPLDETPLNSPWDLLVLDGKLFVAMAGPHQLWVHKLGSQEIRPFAGSGREDVLNGSHKESAFAQPSGLATDGTTIYVCDSEGSAIRAVPADGKGEVTTIAGTSDLPSGRSLFEFGDVDGKGDDARFQHPIGIAIHDGTLYVTDSYNHKIRRITLKDGIGDVTTWLGTGKAGADLDPPKFNEPHGAAVAGGKLYIADTNNHRICVADLKTGRTIALAMEGLAPPASTKSETDFASKKAATVIPAQKVAPGKSLTFEVQLTIPEGYKLNEMGTVTGRLTATGEQPLVAADQLDKRVKAEVDGETATLSIPLAAEAGQGTFELSFSFTYCRDGNGGVCKLSTTRWRIPIEVSAGGGKSVKLQASAE